MATAKPRITVTLNDKSYAVLKAISDCSGQPMSTFISEMLDSARPTLERMASTFQKIKTAQVAERSRFLDDLDDAQSALEPVVMNTLGQFDLFLGKIEEAAEAKGGPRVRGDSLAPAAVSSPPTNRGDTPLRKKQLQASSTKALKPVLKNEVLKKSAVAKTHKSRGKSHAV
jgi:hypothetical protein